MTVSACAGLAFRAISDWSGQSWWKCSAMHTIGENVYQRSLEVILDDISP